MYENKFNVFIVFRDGLLDPLSFTDIDKVYCQNGVLEIIKDKDVDEIVSYVYPLDTIMSVKTTRRY